MEPTVIFRDFEERDIDFTLSPTLHRARNETNN